MGINANVGEKSRCTDEESLVSKVKRFFVELETAEDEDSLLTSASRHLLAVCLKHCNLADNDEQQK